MNAPPDPAVPDTVRSGRGAATAAPVLALVAVAASFFSIAAMQAALVLAGLALAAGRLRGHPRRLRAPLALPIGAFLCASLAAAVAAGPDALHAAASDALPFALFLVVANVFDDRPRLARAVRVALVAAGAAAAGGLAQSAFEGSGFRISGSLSHYMTYSGLLMLSLALALGWALHAARGRERALTVALAALLAAALLMTQTRSAWLGALAASALLLGTWRARALLVLPVVAALAFLLAPGAVQQRVRTMFDLDAAAQNERVAMWRNGLAMIADNPWLGVGPDQVPARYAEYEVAAGGRQEGGVPGHLHDDALQLAAERGLVGLAAWLALWSAWFVAAARVWLRLGPDERAARGATAGALAAAVAFQVMGVFEFNAGDSEVATLCAFLLALPFAARAAAAPAAHESP